MSERLWTLACFVLAGVAYYASSLVPPGGAHDGLVAVAGGLLTLQVTPRGRQAAKAAIVGLVAMFAVGCSTLAPLAPVASDALKAILPAARDELVKEAERRDTDLDANEAICFAAPEEYQPDDYLLVTCIAQESESDE